MHTLYQIGIWALDIWLAMSGATFIFFGALYTVRSLRERAYRDEHLARRTASPPLAPHL
jgi:hypothetical protein